MASGSSVTSSSSVSAEPSAVGMSAQRLRRLDDHFAGYVDAGKLVGWQVIVERAGEIVHASTCGDRVAATEGSAAVPWSDDTIVRLFSMTKPITSVAAMMLYEQGRFQLKDPVAKFLPEFADTPVYRNGSAAAPITEPQAQPMQMWQLMTHTSGLTYGFHNTHVTDAIYRANGFEWTWPAELDLAGCCARWAEMPLAFQPGTEWLYGVSTDVLGRVVEVISGQSLDDFFRDHILGPLAMDDTGFWVRPDDAERFAGLYMRHPITGRATPLPLGMEFDTPPTMLSGGGGLCGTAADYLSFARMLRDRGAAAGDRLLGSRTVDYMTTNHLPGGADLEEFGRPLFAETTFDGVGFGLGFSVVVDPVANRVLGSRGTYSWGGAASTVFWVDPAEELIVVFLTQLMPSSTYPLRPQLNQLVYQALVD